MRSYAIIAVDKQKNMGAITSLERHVERTGKTYQSNPEIISDMTDANYHLIEPQGHYRDVIRKRIEDEKLFTRKDSVLCLGGVISATRDVLENMNDEQQREYFAFALEFVKERFREENIISAVVHMDESKPHMHFIIMPVLDGRLSASRLFCNIDVFRECIGAFKRYMSERYPFLDVPPFSEVKGRDIPIRAYKLSADVLERIDSIIAGIDGITVLNMQKTKKQCISQLTELSEDTSDLRVRLSDMDRCIKDLTEENVLLGNEVYELRNRVGEKESEIDNLREEIEFDHGQTEYLRNLIRLIPKDIKKQYFKGEDVISAMQDAPMEVRS